MARVTITLDNAQLYIDAGLINPKGKINFGGTRTTNGRTDNEHDSWLYLKDALKQGRNFSFTINIDKPLPKSNRKVATTTEDFVVTTPRVLKETPKENEEWYGLKNFEDTFGLSLKEAASYLPWIGDGIDIYDSAIDASNGNYTTAGITLAGLLVPNAIEKPLKGLWKWGKNAYLARKLSKQLDNSKIDPIVSILSNYKQSNLQPKKKYYIGDISKAEKPVDFLNLVPEEELVPWVRKNMDNAIDLMEGRGVTGGYLKLNDTYSKMPKQLLSPEQEKILKEYQGIINKGDPIPSELVLNTTLNTIIFGIGDYYKGKLYLTNINPTKPFGLVKFYPYNRINKRSDNNAAMHLLSKEFETGIDDKLSIPWVKAHETHHGIISPYEDFEVPMFISTPLSREAQYLSNGTEMTARLSLVLNASGIEDGTYKMTPELLYWWSLNYVPLMEKAYPKLDKTLVDNSMTPFFNTIIPKSSKFLDWSFPYTLKLGGKLTSKKKF